MSMPFDKATALAWLDQHHLTVDVVALSILFASFYRNWLWRVVCIAGSVAAFIAVPGAELLPIWGVALLALAILNVPPLRLFSIFREQPETGCVFVTGADSGMGEATVLHLSKSGYDTVYAGCFLESSFEPLKAKVRAAGGDVVKIVPVKLDVTSDASVAAAAATVDADLSIKKQRLIGVINCAGMGFNGPAEYFPMDMYQRQMDVNFFGYIRVTQQFMPLLKAAVAIPGARRARVVYIGTGGGILSPGPPLLTAYMASKWAIEAFCRSIRVEMQLRELPIDCCMVNPGFVKPTMLMSEGLKLNARMWDACATKLGSNVAQEEYGQLLEQFIKYSAEQPGTHVSEVAKTMQVVLAAGRPYSSYKVGADSKAAPIVGSLPVTVSEWIIKKSMFGKLGAV